MCLFSASIFLRLLIHGNVTFVQPGTICHGWKTTWSWWSALQIALRAIRALAALPWKQLCLHWTCSHLQHPLVCLLPPAPPLLHLMPFTSASQTLSSGIPLIYHLKSEVEGGAWGLRPLIISGLRTMLLLKSWAPQGTIRDSWEFQALASACLRKHLCQQGKPC